MTQENSNLFTLAQFLAFASNQTCPHEEELEKVKEELQVLRNSKRPWAYVQFHSSRDPIHTPEEGKKIIREQYPHLDFDSLENTEKKILELENKTLRLEAELSKKNLDIVSLKNRNDYLEGCTECWREEALANPEVKNLEKRIQTWEEDFKKLSRHSDEKDSLISEYENRVRNYMGQLDVLNDRYNEYVNRSLIRFTAEKDKVLFLQRRLCQFELRNSFLEKPGIHDPVIILIKDSISPPTHDIKVLKQAILKTDLHKELSLPWESSLKILEKLERELSQKDRWWEMRYKVEHYTSFGPSFPDWQKKREVLKELKEFLSLLDPGRVFKNVQELEEREKLKTQCTIRSHWMEEKSHPLLVDRHLKKECLKELKSYLMEKEAFDFWPEGVVDRFYLAVEKLEKELRLKPRWWELEYCLVNRGPPESKLPPPVFPAARGPDDPEGEDIPHSLEFPKGRLRS
jgi:hypothetical protein